ncbi:MAG: aminoacyl--tRNA ligase-related protein [Candidatus Paceibacterota bacterium]
MKVSQLFSKTQKKDPKAEASLNAKLLMKAGFIDKLGAGIYTYLPLGLKVIQKIENIAKEELEKINAIEVLMPGLHPKKNWEKTGRWGIQEMFKIGNYGLGWTHEEIITPLAKKFLNSEKDFPKYIYQIQTKYRNEKRAKSGILRGREFIMKDLYSFHLNEEDLNNYYKEVQKAYFKIFERCGLKEHTYLTLADGGAFSEEYSHEFQTITNAGEDTIFICKHCHLALNKEVKQKECPNCKNTLFQEKKAIEVANIFKLKDKYSKPFNFKINDQYILMGCYGLGISRLLGAIVEVFNDENGIIFPTEVAPFDIYLIDIDKKKEALSFYVALKNKGYDVLYDDRDKTPGEKFKDADLLGIPLRVVISEKTLKQDSVEVKKREESISKLIKKVDFKIKSC